MRKNGKGGQAEGGGAPAQGRDVAAQPKRHSRLRASLVLLGLNLFYSTAGIFSKLASMQEPGGIPYFLCVAGAVGVFALYALVWQQVIAGTPLTFAYLFRSSGLVFALMFAAFLWGEPITVNNIAGAAIMMAGILLYVKS